MAVSNARHFAKLLVTQSSSCVRFESGFTASTSQRLFQSSSAPAASAPSSPLIGLPTLGNVPVALNSSKWAAPQAADASAMSIFDIKGAISTLSTPVDPSTMTAGMVALNARVARAQQQQATLAGFRVLPDLTPGRALMWGTILAVWGTATVTVLAARALDIHTLADVPVKMKEHLQPVKEWSRATLSVIPDTFTPLRDSDAMTDAQVFASTVKHNISRRSQPADSWSASPERAFVNAA